MNKLSGWGWLCLFALLAVTALLTASVAHMLPRPILALALAGGGLFWLLKRLQRQP